MNAHDWAVVLCKDEKLKKQVDIAQMTEIVSKIIRQQVNGMMNQGTTYTPCAIIRAEARKLRSKMEKEKK